VSEALRSRLGVVALTQLGDVPGVADVGPTGRLEGAMEGAGIGAAALEGPGVAGLAVGSAAALIGGVAGASRVVPEETVRTIAMQLDRARSEAGAERLLQSAIADEAVRTHVPDLKVISGDLAALVDATRDYRPLSERGIDTVLEVWVVRVDLAGRWGDDPELTLRTQAVARLVDAWSNSVLYAGTTFEHASEPRRFTALSADEGALLEAEIRRAHQVIAASIVDKIYDPVSSWGEFRYAGRAEHVVEPR
jgi:hypothetical protein